MTTLTVTVATAGARPAEVTTIMMSQRGSEMVESMMGGRTSEIETMRIASEDHHEMTLVVVTMGGVALMSVGAAIAPHVGDIMTVTGMTAIVMTSSESASSSSSPEGATLIGMVPHEALPPSEHLPTMVAPNTPEMAPVVPHSDLNGDPPTPAISLPIIEALLMLDLREAPAPPVLRTFPPPLPRGPLLRGHRRVQL